MISGKRELLAHSLFWSGATFLLSKLPKRDLLLVLNYRRIGDPDGHSFYPAIFSATAQELDASLVTLEEALAFPANNDATPRRRLLITFDDGFLELAHATRAEAPPLTQRRFVYWDVARDMIRGDWRSDPIFARITC